MSDDIVERLRERHYPIATPTIFSEAADEIERLRALSQPEGKAEAVAEDETAYDDGYQDGLRDANDVNAEVTQAVARWLDNHLGKGNWYDQAEEGFTADDVIQGLFEAVKDPDLQPSGQTLPKPGRNDGGEPCGECHLQPGETCDICGAAQEKEKTHEPG